MRWCWWWSGNNNIILKYRKIAAAAAGSYIRVLGTGGDLVRELNNIIITLSTAAAEAFDIILYYQATDVTKTHCTFAHDHNCL